MAELTLEKIKFKAKDEKPCKTTFAVQVPAEFFAEKKKKVALEFQRMAQLPGFRQGKAPVEMILKNFSDKVNDATVEQLLKEVVPHVLKEKAIAPVATPMVDQLEVNDSKPVTFNLIVEHSPEFKLKGYKNIPLEKKVKKITSADVDRELETLRDRNAQLVPSKAEAVEKTHFAIIDYAGSMEGKLMPELISENQMIDMNQPQTIAGFAEGILGMKKAESKELPIQFPKEYPNKDLAGKDVVFKITLQDIKEKSTPALDEDFAKDLGLPSLADLKGKIEDSLKHWSEKNTQSELEKQIYDHLVKENQIPVPDSMVEYQLDALVSQALQREFQPQEKKTEQEWDELKKKLREQSKAHAERLVRLSYIINAIANQEKLNASEADIKAEREKAEKANPERVQEIDEFFKKNVSRIASQLTEDKVLKYLTENAKIKEIEAKA